MKVWVRASAASVALAFSACATTATIHRANGPAYEAEIVSSDAASLNVKGDNGRIYAVPRHEVSDVDHPGNVVLLVGAVLAGIGGLAAASVYNDNSGSSQRGSEAAFIGLLYGIPGVLMMTGGGLTYYSSRRNASAFDNARPALIQPPLDNPYQPPFQPPSVWAPPATSPASPPPPPAAPPPEEPQVIVAPPAPPPPAPPPEEPR